MSRIERIRSTALVVRAAPSDVERAEAPDEAAGTYPRAAVDPAVRHPRRRAEDAAAFAAQMIGQDGQKRGLRAGPAHIEAARGAYAKIEWSGSKDRRARKGRHAKTEV